MTITKTHFWKALLSNIWYQERKIKRYYKMCHTPSPIFFLLTSFLKLIPKVIFPTFFFGGSMGPNMVACFMKSSKCHYIPWRRKGKGGWREGKRKILAMRAFKFKIRTKWLFKKKCLWASFFLLNLEIDKKRKILEHECY